MLCRAVYAVRGEDALEASWSAQEDGLIPGCDTSAEMCGWMGPRAVFLAVKFREDPNFAATIEQSRSRSGRRRCFLASAQRSQAFLTAGTRRAAVIARLRSTEAFGGEVYVFDDDGDSASHVAGRGIRYGRQTVQKGEAVPGIGVGAPLVGVFQALFPRGQGAARHRECRGI